MIKYGQIKPDNQGMDSLKPPKPVGQPSSTGQNKQNNPWGDMIVNGIQGGLGKVEEIKKFINDEVVNPLDEKYVQPIMRKKRVADAFNDLIPTLTSAAKSFGMPMLMNSFLGGMRSRIGQMGQIGQNGQNGQNMQRPKYYRSLGEK